MTKRSAVDLAFVRTLQDIKGTMRRKIMIAATSVLAICAIGVVSVASASATVLQNKEGLALVKKGLTSFGANFTIKSGAVEVICKKEKGSGSIIAGSKVAGEERRRRTDVRRPRLS